MNQNRREFIETTLMTFIAAKMGAIEPGRAFGPLKQIDAGVLNVGYAEAGLAVLALDQLPPHRVRHGEKHGTGSRGSLRNKRREGIVAPSSQ